MLSRICPSCGREAKEFVKNFCLECFGKQRKLLEFPREDFLLCSRCGLFKMGSWVARSELEERVLGKTRFAFDVLEKRMELEERGKEILVKCSFALSVDGKRVEGKEEAFIPVEKGLCPECELRASGYYEAIFQVRGENREKMEKTAQRLSRLVEKRSFVSKVVSLKEGIDLFVGNRKEAMEIASHLGLETTVSNKLAGKRKDGKSLFRTTVCVRV